MGEFTQEEKIILGEAEPDPPKEPEIPPSEGDKPPEGEKTEQKAEEAPTDEEKKAAEDQGFKLVTEHGKTYFVDDEGAKVPAKRFKAVYREREDAKRNVDETNRKFNLFKELGPEKFYEIYPDEKPAGWKQPVEKPVPKATYNSTLGNHTVQGGPYDGKSLNEVWAEDPAYASWLQSQYLNAEREKTETERQTAEHIKKESEDEVNSFGQQLAKDIFGKEVSKLNAKEESKVSETIQSVLDWMSKSRRGGGILADAYFLMNKDGILADAKSKGGKEALESLKRPSVASVNTSGGTTTTPFAGYEGMSGDQLAEAVAKMSESAYLKFLKDAPQSLREKHSGLPWS